MIAYMLWRHYGFKPIQTRNEWIIKGIGPHELCNQTSNPAYFANIPNLDTAHQ